jgi:hypothetical protein
MDKHPCMCIPQTFHKKAEDDTRKIAQKKVECIAK